MKEELLQYIWAHKQLSTNKLISTEGEPIEIIRFGEWNRDAGPDFFNAKIKIGNTLWAGNVEIHVQASDWLRHKHDSDPKYKNVILHVVYHHDTDIYRESGQVIPTVELEVPKALESNYEELSQRSDWLRCLPELGHIDSFLIDFYLARIICDRIEDKTKYIQLILDRTKGDWHETFFQILCRSLGAHVNSEPFEQLARSTPLRTISKHKDQLFQIEALLMGQAGFLNQELLGDSYFLDLRKEYSFLYRKYQLKPIVNHNWKFMRMRPNNFPTIRVAQLAKLIYTSKSLLSSLQEKKSIDELRELFQVSASTYWDTHYTFNRPSDYKPKFIGKTTFMNILINTVVPFLFIFGEHQNKLSLKKQAFEILNQLPAEQNRITKHWQESGMTLDSAAQSQAILQLKKSFCDKGRCLQCEIGNRLIRGSGKQVNEIALLQHSS